MLDMSANGLLGGSLPQALTTLPALAWANFSATAINGLLPENWTQTAQLDCSLCNLTGVPHGPRGSGRLPTLLQRCAKRLWSRRDALQAM